MFTTTHRLTSTALAALLAAGVLLATLLAVTAGHAGNAQHNRLAPVSLNTGHASDLMAIAINPGD